MRIWDLNPGYLNRQSLLGEHRELHGIESIIRQRKKGYAKHPETMRWVGNETGLWQRHELLAAEMTLRGYQEKTPILKQETSVTWPEQFIDSAGGQFGILGDKYSDKEQGRIPLPTCTHQLWAQHKYSIMARHVGTYRRIGRQVSALKGKQYFDQLAQELVVLLRQRPSAGGLQNAVMHLWGYVSKYSNLVGAQIQQTAPLLLLKEIQHLAVTNEVDYLTASTALSELGAWH